MRDEEGKHRAKGAAFFAGVALLTAGCRTPAPTDLPAGSPQPPAGSSRAVPGDEPGGKALDPKAPPSSHVADPDQPFTVTTGAILLQPPYRFASLATVEGTMSGSIHSPRPAGVFFTRPEFQTPEHDGRLYYTRYLGHDRHGKNSSLAFITWRPLGAAQDRAQRVRAIPGWTVEDLQTDGRVLLVHHYPPWPSKARTSIQEYHWRGDQAGHGMFVLHATRKGPPAQW